MSTKKTVLNWIEVEAKAYSGHSSSQNEDANESIFRARSLEHRYRQAEALCLIDESADSLQSLRTKISRGQITEAEEHLQKYLSENSSHASDPEYLLEIARLHAFRGEWEKAHLSATQVLEKSPSGVTKMTALQCRSIASYELGQWTTALRDIELIRAIGLLYPLAPAPFYAEVLRVKVEIARERFDVATEILADLWRRDLKEGRLNTDRLLTFLRAEADLKRSQGQFPLGEMQAAHTVANLMGDELYSAMALFEMNGEVSEETKTRFLKLASLADDVSLQEPVTTTGRLLRKSFVNASKASLERNADLLFIPSQFLLIELNPFRVVVSSKMGQPLKTLLFLLQNKDCSKADLFSHLFEGQKYVAHLHDSVLHQGLSRLRKLVGPRIQIEGGLIRISGILLAGNR